ncbi:MAG TPA: hypothetical protein VF487_20260 [Chitinophagaceae bacterium]
MTEFLKKVSTGEIRNIIAIVSVIGAFVMLYLIIMKPIPAGNKDTVNLAVGFLLGGLIGGVNGYFFGNSKPNTVKDPTE